MKPKETETWFLSLTVTHKAKQNRREVIVIILSISRCGLCVQYKQVDLQRLLKGAALKHHFIFWRAVF